MERTWKPKTAGILTIIAACIGIGIGAAIAIGGGFLGGLGSNLSFTFAAAGKATIGLGVVALIGGIFTLKRKIWGLSLAGAICATFCMLPLGVLSIIFVAMGRKEFD
ncbi:MAG: hypothetical protein J7K77_00685 [Dehalococcoidales bacterium]|nr:hypothetical protein [Dehalococcoidales bacterium]